MFPLGDVTIDIIQEGTKGLFGIVGGKEAIVRLTVKESEQEDDILSAFLPADTEPAPAEDIPKLKQKKNKPAHAKKNEAEAKPSKAPARRT